MTAYRRMLKTLPLDTIGSYIVEFIAFATSSPTMRFELTPIGCGLAG